MFNIIFANVWIQTADLWIWKRLLYQLNHHHCPSMALLFGFGPSGPEGGIFIEKGVYLDVSIWKGQKAKKLKTMIPKVDSFNFYLQRQHPQDHFKNFLFFCFYAAFWKSWKIFDARVGFFFGGGIFVDDDGTKDDEQMIVDWAISGYFKPQNSLESVFTRSRCDYTDGQYM